MAQERLEICEGCIKNKMSICTMCGCPLDMKARVKEEECDLDKWP